MSSVPSPHAAPHAGPAIRDTGDLCRLLGIAYTDEQLAAITAPLRPGVIVAGAGSGKTTVMAARVVWLVGRGEVAPDRVLGLTFTNKAAAELAERVRTALGRAGLLRTDLLPEPGAAGDDLGDDLDPGEPVVSTYHAYADRLIKEHGLRLGVEPGAALLADAARFQVAAAAVRAAEGPFEELRGDVASLSEQVLALDGELSEHLVSPRRLRGFDAGLIACAAAVTDPGTGKPKRGYAPLAAAAAVARARTELSWLVESYRAAKRSRDVIDFGDQMVLGARLAEESPETGRAEREKYGVVLLDEYQDTSVAQRRMLVGLFGPPHGAGHPVTAVGDPCQSIYGWRGASVANLDDFPEHFPAVRADGTRAPAARFTLTENRRSGGRLLAFANELSEPLREVHDGVTALRPCREKAAGGWAHSGLLPTHAADVSWLADQVVRRHHEDGADWAEIAVLVRKGAHIEPLYAELRARGVPVEVVGLSGLLDLPEIADLTAMLDVIDEPIANASLVRLLAGPRWRIGPRDLALLGRRARQLVADAVPPAAAGLDRAVARVDAGEIVSLSDAMADPGDDLPFSPEARARFAAFATEIRTLRRSLCEPLLDVVHRVISVTGLDVETAAAPAQLEARCRETLDTFTARAAAWVGGAAELGGDATVTAFRAYLRAAARHERGIDVDLPATGDSVKLLTMHKAKGLEWDVVVVPHLCAENQRSTDRWTKSARVLPFALRGDAEHLPELGDGYTTTDFKAFDTACREHAALEDLRLSYVTFTRARARVVASAHWWGPTQTGARGPDAELDRLAEHCRAGNGTVEVWTERADAGERNPTLDAPEVRWPVVLDPDAARRRARGADLVLGALRDRDTGALPHQPAGPEPAVSGTSVLDDAEAGARLSGVDDAPESRSGTAELSAGELSAGELSAEELSAEEQALVASWDRDLPVLLDEARQGRSGRREAVLPLSLSATDLLRLAADPDAFAREIVRPLPRRPAPQARRGTRFHAWVESRFGQRPLLDVEDLPGADDTEIEDDRDLDALKQAFTRSPYAERAPYRIEQSFQLALGGRVVRGRIDAVYRNVDPDDGSVRYEVVDWKTGRSHNADPAQLAVYRLAWAEIAGVPPESVDAYFFYVRDNRAVRPRSFPSRTDLARILAPDEAASG